MTTVPPTSIGRVSPSVHRHVPAGKLRPAKRKDGCPRAFEEFEGDATPVDTGTPKSASTSKLTPTSGAPKNRSGSQTQRAMTRGNVPSKPASAPSATSGGVPVEKSPSPPRNAVKPKIPSLHCDPVKWKSSGIDTIFSTKLTPEGNFCAVAMGDGSVHFFTVTTATSTRKEPQLNPKKKVKTLMKPSDKDIHMPNSGEELPCVQVKFSPRFKEKPICLCACSNGSVQQIDIGTGTVVHANWEPRNEVLTVDYSSDGKHYASAGSDRVVRVYDNATNQCMAALQSGIDYQGRVTAGHSNRIFAVKFMPSAFGDPNVLLSGGWDNTVQLYDIRTRRTQRTFFGAKISGDTIEIERNFLFTGSCRQENQIVLFDILSGVQLPQSRPLSAIIGETQLYGLKHNRGTLWCCGSMPNTLFQIDMKTNTVTSVHTSEHTLFSVDVFPDGKHVVAGGSFEVLEILH